MKNPKQQQKPPMKQTDKQTKNKKPKANQNPQN